MLSENNSFAVGQERRSLLATSSGKPPLSVTHYSVLQSSKVISADSLKSSLSAGSKKRLMDYMRNLSVSRGNDKDRKYDSKLIKVLGKYVYNSSALRKQLRYLDSVRDEDGYLFSRCLKIYSSTEKALTLFSSPDYTSFRWNENYQKAVKLLKGQFSKHSLQPLHFMCDNDIKCYLPKVSTHSGYTYVETGYKKKGDNMEGLFERFKCATDEAIINGSYSRPIMIGFRTQGSGEYEDDGSQTGTCKHKTRVISMVDLLQIVAELKFSYPIQKLLAADSRYAGGKDDYNLSSIVSTHNANYRYWSSIDYSSYDQTISSWLIEDAFDILKSAFRNMDDRDEAIWNVMVNDFIHKDFIVSEGLIHSDRGVPSGSMFTQIIDTVVNWIMIYAFSFSVNMDVNMIAMGDDNLIYSNKPISMPELASYLRKNFGVVVHDDEKSNCGNTSSPPKFLSCYWTIGGKWRHPNQLISRMAYPERYREYNTSVTPEIVLYAYILSYPKGMSELMDVDRFMHDTKFTGKDVLKLVDGYSVLPGSVAYQLQYGLVA